MPFTFAQLLLATRTSPHIITHETAAYLVLGLAEQSVAAPRCLGANAALLHPNGGVTIGEVAACAPRDADRRLRALLAALLAPGPGASAPDALRQIAEGPAVGPDALRAELTAALIPLNRAAARRALARLYRRLAALELPVSAEWTPPPRAEALGVDPVAPQPVVGSTGASDEIEVEVDESEWQHDASLRQLPEGEAKPDRGLRLPPVVDAVAASPRWHPAQTTPWQFNQNPSALNDGTPLLGSLTVRDRQRDESSVVAPQPPPRSTYATSAALPRRTDAAEPPPGLLEHDTWVDAPVGAAVHFGQFRSRRSSVRDLVEQFSTPLTPDEDEVRHELLHLAEQDLSLGAETVTPPPVERAALPTPKPNSPPPKPRRVLLGGLAALLAVAGVGASWVQRMQASDVAPAAPSPIASEPSCSAAVRVEVPAAALVYLNDDQTRIEVSGPVAVFEQVACDAQAEVTVRMPTGEREGSAASWVRVPLPEPDLRRAAASGQPLTISPLGD